jgi:hypothetical protein
MQPQCRVKEATAHTLPIIYSRINKFRHWYSNRLSYYVRRKTYIYRRYKKMGSHALHGKFCNYSKFVKPTVTSDRYVIYLPTKPQR